MALMLSTTAEGRDWPKALTFLGRGDTAIVILTPTDALEPTGSFDAQVLTRRGETPVFLVGDCSPA